MYIHTYVHTYVYIGVFVYVHILIGVALLFCSFFQTTIPKEKYFPYRFSAMGSTKGASGKESCGI